MAPYNFSQQEVVGMGFKKNQERGKKKAEEEGLQYSCLPLKKRALYLQEENENRKEGFSDGETRSNDVCLVGNNPENSHIETCLVQENLSLSSNEGQPSKESKIDQKEERYQPVVPKKKRTVREFVRWIINNPRPDQPVFALPDQPVLPHPDQPVLPVECKDRLRDLNGGTQIQGEFLVLEKTLQESDIAPQQNRLLIPFSQVRNEFLSEEEKAYLLTRTDNGRHVNKLEVKLIDPMGELRQVYLRRWAMKKTLSKEDQKESTSEEYKVTEVYVINGPSWKSIVEDNSLKAGEKVHLWAVPVQGSLWFALVRLPMD